MGKTGPRIVQSGSSLAIPLWESPIFVTRQLTRIDSYGI